MFTIYVWGMLIYNIMHIKQLHMGLHKHSYILSQHHWREIVQLYWRTSNCICSSFQSDSQYSLCAVIVHSGDAMFGHYTAYVRHKDQSWYYANDSYVRQVRENEWKNVYTTQQVCIMHIPFFGIIKSNITFAQTQVSWKEVQNTYGGSQR